jgi:hypothetical protein
MTYIFESPDGGDTIYRRLPGRPERELYKVSEKKTQQNSVMAEWIQWRDILESAQHNPALQNALDQAKIIYVLGKHD